jgi:hypothetical protein
MAASGSGNSVFTSNLRHISGNSDEVADALCPPPQPVNGLAPSSVILQPVLTKMSVPDLRASLEAINEQLPPPRPSSTLPTI